MKLTTDHIACLRVLDRLGTSGALTGNLAARVGVSFRASWATNRMRTLTKRGLVVRHETNHERWFITPAGRAAITPDQGERDGHG